MRRNHDTELSEETMTGNYELVYYVAENVEIIGILAYPKIIVPKIDTSISSLFIKLLHIN